MLGVADVDAGTVRSWLGVVMFVSEDAGCCECSAGTLRSWMQVLRCLLVKMLGVVNVLLVP